MTNACITCKNRLVTTSSYQCNVCRCIDLSLTNMLFGLHNPDELHILFTSLSAQQRAMVRKQVLELYNEVKDEQWTINKTIK